MKKHPRRYPCDLCGQRYAVLNSTLHVSPHYKLKFCKVCTVIVLSTIQKLKHAVKLEEWKKEHV